MKKISVLIALWVGFAQAMSAYDNTETHPFAITAKSVEHLNTQAQAEVEQYFDQTVPSGYKNSVFKLGDGLN